MKLEGTIHFVISKFEIFFGIKKLQACYKAHKLSNGYKKLFTDKVITSDGKNILQLKPEIVGLSMPKDGLQPKLKFSIETDISFPENIDNRSLIPATKDQGTTPYCAGYSSTKFLEQYLWRKQHKKYTLDPVEVYKKAKEIDGMPNVAGTDLVSALKACMELGYVDKTKFDIRTINPGRSALTEIKAAIHKHTAILMGFDITSEWFKPTQTGQDFIITGHKGQAMGGHAVLCCGYKNGKIEISNSWGNQYGDNGVVYVTEEEFHKSFLYGALLVKKKNFSQNQ